MIILRQMKYKKYTEQALDLAKAIDIAVSSIQKFPYKDWSEANILHIINTYNSWKEDALNPEPKYKNVKSLSYVVDSVFIWFDEASGEGVDYFWESIKLANLPYKRKNKLGSVLKRQKIKNQIEYDFIVDVIVPYQQEGLIGKEEVVVLNKLLAEFESRHAEREKK